MLRFVSLFAVLSISSLAIAEPIVRVYSESADGNRPRCLQSQTGTHIFLKWNDGDHFYRDILETHSTLPCENWRFVNAYPWGWKTVEPKQMTLEGNIELSDALVEQIDQIRNGASVIRAEETVQDYLAAHPIAKYTQEVNADLSGKYGVGFSGKVYQESLLHDEKNALARAIFERYWEQARATTVQARTTEESKIKVLFANGFGLPSDADLDATPQFEKDIIRELAFVKYPARMLNNDPVGDFNTNAALYAGQITRELAAGHDLVLGGASKGVVELLAAISKVTANHLDENRRQYREEGRGRILGVFNMSGLVSGTFIADYLNSIPGSHSIADLLKRSGFKFYENNLGDYLQALTRLGTHDTKNYMAPVFVSLPSDVVYLNFVGVQTDYSKPVNNYAGGADLMKLLRTTHASNIASDGLIEFPGTEIPRTVSDQTYTFAIDGATHMIFDGNFEGVTFLQARNRIAFSAASLNTILELAGVQ